MHIVHTHSHTLKINLYYYHFLNHSNSDACGHTTVGLSAKALTLFHEQSEVQGPKLKERRTRNTRSIRWSGTAQHLPLLPDQINNVEVSRVPTSRMST